MCYRKSVFRRKNDLEKTDFMSFIPHSRKRSGRFHCVELRRMADLQTRMCLRGRIKCSGLPLFEGTAYSCLWRRILQRSAAGGERIEGLKTSLPIQNGQTKVIFCYHRVSIFRQERRRDYDSKNCCHYLIAAAVWLLGGTRGY